MRAAVLLALAASAVATIDFNALRGLCHDGLSCQRLADDLPSFPLPAAVRGDELSALLKDLVGSRAVKSDGSWLSDGLLGFTDVDKQWCPNNSFYQFIPVHMGSLYPVANGGASWAASCYQSTSASLSLTSTGGVVTFTASDPSTLLCDDMYLITTAYKTYFMDVSTLSAGRTLNIDTWQPNELEYVKKFGLRIMVLPCGIVGTVTSAINTVELFVGSDLIEINGKFLVERNIYPPLQPFGKQQVIDASLIKSGDYLAVARFDGLDPMVMFGTGGRTGHSTVAVWEGDQLYVVESTDSNPFGASYWPPPYGIIRTPYKQWIAQAMNASYMVGLLPLAPAYAGKFNEDAFWSWFKTVEGQPYGYHTFMYCFLDTARPMANLPEPIEEPAFTWVLTALDRILGESGKVNMYSIFTEGINKRLNLSCSTMDCVSDYLLTTNSTTLADVTAIPEQDSWRYDGGNTSMTCSMFALAVWAHGFQEMAPYNDIQANEQTPKDNYQTAIFDPHYFNEQNCPIGLMNTAAGTYCQLMGTYRLPLNGYNTIPPYAGMNNVCPSQWPAYERCPTDKMQCC